MEKHVLGLSLGSSSRDFKISFRLFNRTIFVERRGTDGNFKQLAALLQEYDGKVDAIGLGGMDIWLWSNNKRYAWRQPKKLLKLACKTPLVDGSGLKNSLERMTIRYLQRHGIIDFPKSKTLLVCAVDRFGMAEEIYLKKGRVIYGDFIFSLGIPLPIRSLRSLRAIAFFLLPIMTQLPVKWLYPTGKKQEESIAKFSRYYAWADVICGDNHFICRYLPDDLSGKAIITNTTTKKDVEAYSLRRAQLLVTTTPCFEGRSPGTNVFEAAIVAALGIRDPDRLTMQHYEDILRDINWQPNVVKL